MMLISLAGIFCNRVTGRLSITSFPSKVFCPAAHTSRDKPGSYLRDRNKTKLSSEVQNEKFFKCFLTIKQLLGQHHTLTFFLKSYQNISAWSVMNTYWLIDHHCWSVTEALKTNQQTEITCIACIKDLWCVKQQQFRQADRGDPPSQQRTLMNKVDHIFDRHGIEQEAVKCNHTSMVKTNIYYIRYILSKTIQIHKGRWGRGSVFSALTWTKPCSVLKFVTKEDLIQRWVIF